MLIYRLEDAKGKGPFSEYLIFKTIDDVRRYSDANNVLHTYPDHFDIRLYPGVWDD